MIPFALVSALVVAAPTAAERPRLAVLVVIDQLSADTFEARLPLASQGIRRLVAQGHRVRECRYETAPTITSVGHATLATGAWPQVHGVVANEWVDHASGQRTTSTEDPAYAVTGREPKPRDGTSPRWLMAPTLGDALKAFDPNAKVVAISGKDRSAILPAGHAADAVLWLDAWSPQFVTSTYFAPAVPAWVAPVNQTLFHAVASELELKLPGGGFTGQSPSTVFQAVDAGPHDLPTEDLRWQPLHEKVEVDLALAAVENLGLGKDAVPDFLSISFSGHDFIAHAHGSDSPELVQDFLRLDVQIGRLLDGLDKLVGKDKYVLALTADHGGSQVPETLAARKLDAGRIDIKALQAVLETKADQSLGTGDWLDQWKTPGYYLTPKGRAKVRELEEPLRAAARAINGVHELFSARALLEGRITQWPAELYRRGLYEGRSPDLLVLGRAHWMTGRDRAGHGTWYRYDRMVPLVFFGGGVKKGETPFATAVDVAPTLASHLGVPPPSATQGTRLQF